MQTPQRLEQAVSPGPELDLAAFPLSPARVLWLERAHADISLAWPSSPLTPLRRTSPLVASAAASDDFLSDNMSHAPPPPPHSVSSSQPVAHRSTASASSAASSSCTPSSSRSPSPPSGEVPSSRPTASACAPSSPTSSDAEPRVTDAERRRKEKAAFIVLARLSSEDGASEATRGGVLSAGSTARRRRKRSRLSVLEASAARIHQLERLLNTAELAKHMAEAQVRALSSIQRERESAQLLVASNALHATCRLRGRVARTLFDCRSGRLLDASSSFFEVTGFTPSGSLQRVLNPRFVQRLTEDDESDACEVALVKTRCRRSGSNGRRSADASTEWIPIQSCNQYPATLQLMHEFQTGQRDSFTGVFRNRFADGHMYELPEKLCYVVDAELVEEADGRRWRRPLTRACAYALDGCIRVEEEWE